MACRLFGCWTPLCIVLFLLSSISADPSLTPRYVLHSTRGTFDDAMQRCSPGVLTTLATNQEVDDILKLVSNSVPLQDDFTFWLGLRKAKNECVVPAQPLRGFRWTADGSEESQVSRWAEEPVLTCTGVRCAALKGQFDGSTTSWGLIPVKCKNEYPFICKLKGGLTEGSPEATEPSKPATPKTRPATSEHVPTTPEPELPTEEPEPELVPGPGPDPITVCLQCSHGFHKDAAGRCMDVDECADPTRTPCKHTCLNTEGSYRCVCSDADGKQHDEGSLTCQDLVMVEDGGALSGILVPVLIAVAALVVLVVVVAVTVKCCLMRRSKKRAIKAAEKMAMKSKQQKDAFQTANEKTAT
uniref:C-type lectin domain containing 14A n=1 Tax=Stegastes partitus TaxID=144197 RepID=A0A3B4Z9R4_9TELE